jgi:hypothetical protein
MIKATLIIPTVVWNNDYIASVVARLTKMCGGCTKHSPSYGYWIDSNGNLIHEQITQVFVTCEDSYLCSIKEIAKQVASDLNQDCVYLDWHECNMELITR